MRLFNLRRPKVRFRKLVVAVLLVFATFSKIGSSESVSAAPPIFNYRLKYPYNVRVNNIICYPMVSEMIMDFDSTNLCVSPGGPTSSSTYVLIERAPLHQFKEFNNLAALALPQTWKNQKWTNCMKFIGADLKEGTTCVGDYKVERAYIFIDDPQPIETVRLRWSDPLYDKHLMTHEMGHVVSLKHDNNCIDSDSVMTRLDWCEGQYYMTELQDDDKAAINSMYP